MKIFYLMQDGYAKQSFLFEDESNERCYVESQLDVLREIFPSAQYVFARDSNNTTIQIIEKSLRLLNGYECLRERKVI